MLSGKAQAATKPTAMGSLLQAATYGQPIPSIGPAIGFLVNGS